MHDQQKLKRSLFRRVLRFIPHNKEEYQQKKVALFFACILVTIGAYVILTVATTAYGYITHFSPKELLFTLATDLETDDQERTNVLLLGTGGGDHEGPDLTDTMIIASINRKKRTISMLSIPRDLWLEIPGYGSSRINKVYENLLPVYGTEKSLKIFTEGIENITGLEIPYYVKIDFKAFKEAINILGGIEIDVPQRIEDNLYPNDSMTNYQTFIIEKGLQTLDGETALKFARSRHSTSDFDRAQRQQLIIESVKEKALSSETLTSPLKLKKLYDKYHENIVTNLNINEMISGVRIAQEMIGVKISSHVLRDIDVIMPGSFLYTPDRNLYGGAFVLLPLGNTYREIHKFIEVNFSYPEVYEEKARIRILNGTLQSGLARDLGNRLVAFDLNVAQLGNAELRNFKKTHFIVHNEEKSIETKTIIPLLLPSILEVMPDEIDPDKAEFDITIVLGEDYIPMDLYNPYIR